MAGLMQLTLWSHFKGGPWDGRFVSIPDDRRVWYAPKPVPPVLLVDHGFYRPVQPWLQCYEYVRSGTNFVMRGVRY